MTDESEDVKLIGPMEGNPRLEIKSHRCSQCAYPTRELGTLCSECLKKQFMREVLVMQGQFLKVDSDYPIEVGKVRNRPHLALVGHPDLSWCGDKITQPRKQRVHVRRGEKFPDGTCAVCLQRYFEVQSGLGEAL